MGAEPRATIRCVAAAHSQAEQGLKDTLPALHQMRARAYRGCTVGGVGGDQRRVERRRAMAAAVELGRAATMASVRAAGDDVARPLSALHHATEPPRGSHVRFSAFAKGGERHSASAPPAHRVTTQHAD